MAASQEPSCLRPCLQLISTDLSQEPFKSNPRALHAHLSGLTSSLHSAYSKDPYLSQQKALPLLLTSLSRFLRSFVNETSFSISDYLSTETIILCIDRLIRASQWNIPIYLSRKEGQIDRQGQGQGFSFSFGNR